MGREESGSAPSVAVVRAIAKEKGVDPAELTPPLVSAVDPDALDALFERNGTAGIRLSFEYGEYTVTVSDSGDVEVQSGQTAQV